MALTGTGEVTRGMCLRVVLTSHAYVQDGRCCAAPRPDCILLAKAKLHLEADAGTIRRSHLLISADQC